MKLIIQIPCFNEAGTLKDVIEAIPEKIDGIDVIETLVIDDGSNDGTADYARELGVTHILINQRNMGLAKSFSKGIEACLRQGADIIVNTDGDNQYPSEEIGRLVEPILAGKADIVIGDRGGMDNPHFSHFKKRLQVIGSRIVSYIVGLDIPDAVSGFRAISRSVAEEIHILTSFSYTIEMLVQADARKMRVVSIPIKTNEKTRESRLFKSIPGFIKMSAATLLRAYTMHRPLKAFGVLGALIFIVGLFPIFRFVYFYIFDSGAGHIQSLILGGTLVMLGFLTAALGILADLIAFNRKLTEKMLERISVLEDKVSQVLPNEKSKKKR